MTFQKLHCALIAAACAGIVICAAALSFASDFKMQEFKAPEFKMNEFKMQEFRMNSFAIPSAGYVKNSAQPKPASKNKKSSSKSSKKGTATRLPRASTAKADFSISTDH